MRSLLIALAALAVLAPAADAKLVVQESLAGVKLGMKAAEVRDVLGEPKHVDYPKNDIQGTVKHMDYGLTDVYLYRGEKGTVYTVTTTSRRQRTDKGIGVGSTESALRKAIPRAKCMSFGDFRDCTVGKQTAGQKVTAFVISPSTMKVKRITLGYVID